MEIRAESVDGAVVADTTVLICRYSRAVCGNPPARAARRRRHALHLRGQRARRSSAAFATRSFRRPAPSSRSVAGWSGSQRIAIRLSLRRAGLARRPGRRRRRTSPRRRQSRSAPSLQPRSPLAAGWSATGIVVTFAMPELLGSAMTAARMLRSTQQVGGRRSAQSTRRERGRPARDPRRVLVETASAKSARGLVVLLGVARDDDERPRARSPARLLGSASSRTRTVASTGGCSMSAAPRSSSASSR